jgi:hypothetical protein
VGISFLQVFPFLLPHHDDIKVFIVLPSCYLLTRGNTTTSGKEDDSLFWDILAYLSMSVDHRLQWRELNDNLHIRYEKTYDKETFKTLLNRNLKRLRGEGYVKTDDVGHQQVYYFIPKRKQKKIVEELGRHFAHRKLDEYWDTLSLDQRRKAIESLMAGHQMIAQAEKGVIVEVKNFAQSLIAQVEDRLKEENNYTPDEILKFKTAIHDSRDELSKITSGMTADEKYIREKWLVHFNLVVEFENKVVNPYYNGVWYEATADLMRKAIAEQEAKKLH